MTDTPESFTSEDPSKIPLLPSEIINLKRLAEEDTKEWSCFNPSIGYSPKKGYAIAFRSSNYVILKPHGELHVTNGGKIRNRVYFADLDKNLKIKNFRRIEMPSNIEIERGIEDPKLYWRNNAWHFTAVMMEKHTPVARVCVCKLDPRAKKVVEITTYDGPNPDKPEKSWLVPNTTPSEHFDFVYGPHSIVKGNKIIQSMSTERRTANLRGNSHLVEQKDGTYLAVMHRLWTKVTRGYSPNVFGMVDGLDKNYSHYFVRFDRFGSVIEMTPGFQFISAGIEFAAGMIEYHDKLVVSFGKEDVSSHLSIIDKSLVEKMMRPVE